MKSSVVIWDEAELLRQLARCQKAFTGRRSARLGKITEPAANPPLEIDYQPEDFIDITLTVEIPDASTQATAAFFCMYPILLDLVRSACFDLAPVYPSSHSEFTAYHDGNSVSQAYTVKKSFDWQSAGKTAQSYLQAFDITPHASPPKRSRRSFQDRPVIHFGTNLFLPANCHAVHQRRLGKNHYCYESAGDIATDCG